MNSDLEGPKTPHWIMLRMPFSWLWMAGQHKQKTHAGTNNRVTSTLPYLLTSFVWFWSHIALLPYIQILFLFAFKYLCVPPFRKADLRLALLSLHLAVSPIKPFLAAPLSDWLCCPLGRWTWVVLGFSYTFTTPLTWERPRCLLDF